MGSKKVIGVLALAVAMVMLCQETYGSATVDSQTAVVNGGADKCEGQSSSHTCQGTFCNRLSAVTYYSSDDEKERKVTGGTTTELCKTALHLSCTSYKDAPDVAGCEKQKAKGTSK